MKILQRLVCVCLLVFVNSGTYIVGSYASKEDEDIQEIHRWYCNVAAVRAALVEHALYPVPIADLISVYITYEGLVPLKIEGKDRWVYYMNMFVDQDEHFHAFHVDRVTQDTVTGRHLPYEFFCRETCQFFNYRQYDYHPYELASFRDTKKTIETECGITLPYHFNEYDKLLNSEGVENPCTQEVTRCKKDLMDRFQNMCVSATAECREQFGTTNIPDKALAKRFTVTRSKTLAEDPRTAEYLRVTDSLLEDFLPEKQNMLVVTRERDCLLPEKPTYLHYYAIVPVVDVTHIRQSVLAQQEIDSQKPLKTEALETSIAPQPEYHSESSRLGKHLRNGVLVAITSLAALQVVAKCASTSKH